MPPVVAVFGSSSSLPGDGWFEAGLRCGRLLAESGYEVATGGYAGLMEAVSRGAAEAGAHVIGVTVPDAFPGRSGANAWVDTEVAAPTLADRIRRITEMSSACIVLDGSIGTFTELLVAWNTAYVDARRGAPPNPIVAVGDRWARLVPIVAGDLVADRSTVTLVHDVDLAVAEVRRRVPVVNPPRAG